ncbi:MAG: murein L,D-transpeptidase family protein [Chitinophagales bacterium]
MKRWKPIIYSLLILSFVLADTSSLLAPSFLQTQLQHHRVRAARSEKDANLQKLFDAKGLQYPPKAFFMRVFKSEHVIELWAADEADTPMTLVNSYDVCAMSGDLGPKSKQGDRQVPEGFYHISRFNPNSNYYLSLKINYPNKADRLRSSFSNLGGDIYIHGHCASWGCVSITDPIIKEVYWLAAQVQYGGMEELPVHIFPSRLSDFKYAILQHLYEEEPANLQLWNSLKQAYDYFETYKEVPQVEIDASGEYLVGDENQNENES